MKAHKNKAEELRREMLTPAASLHVRETLEGETPSRTITGYAILFNTPSEPLWDDEQGVAREEIAPEAVTLDLLNSSDIKFTMFHDRQLILARSNKGKGTLSYSIDDKGVKFEFDAPATVDGDKALELVKRGDIAGCSFAFFTRYWDHDFVERVIKTHNGAVETTYRIKVISGIADFTLATDPAYPATSVEARELREALKEMGTPDVDCAHKQICALRAEASRKLF